jgi:hypothetical protein
LSFSHYFLHFLLFNLQITVAGLPAITGVLMARADLSKYVSGKSSTEMKRFLFSSTFSFRAWTTLTEAMSSFLSPFGFDNSAFADEDEGVKSWQDLQATLVDLLIVTVLPRTQSAPATLLQQLLTLILLETPENVSDAQRRLETVCLTGMFTLCRDDTAILAEGGRKSSHQADGASRSIATIACPMLITRCSQILRSCVEVETSEGIVPARLKEQACFVLQQLGSLLIHPDVSASLFRREILVSIGYRDASGRAKDSSRQESAAAPDESLAENRKGQASPRYVAASERNYGHRGHLLKLFPVLCDCIRLNDLQIRLLLAKVLSRCTESMEI